MSTPDGLFLFEISKPACNVWYMGSYAPVPTFTGIEVNLTGKAAVVSNCGTPSSDESATGQYIETNQLVTDMTDLDGHPDRTVGIIWAWDDRLGLYFTPSDFATTAGNWTTAYDLNDNAIPQGSTGPVININSAGVVFMQDPTSGCVLNGQVVINYPAFDIYQMTGQLANCTGTYSRLNGVPGSGLFFLKYVILANAGVAAKKAFFSMSGGMMFNLTDGTHGFIDLTANKN